MSLHSFETVHAHAAAIDIGATIHVAAVGPDRDPEPVRTFGTFTDEIRRMADWLAACGAETIVMESTGIYWIPAYEILEERGFDVQLVNARDAKHVYRSTVVRQRSALTRPWVAGRSDRRGPERASCGRAAR